MARYYSFPRNSEARKMVARLKTTLLRIDTELNILKREFAIEEARFQRYRYKSGKLFARAERSAVECDKLKAQIESLAHERSELANDFLRAYNRMRNAREALVVCRYVFDCRNLDDLAVIHGLTPRQVAYILTIFKRIGGSIVDANSDWKRF